MKKTYYITKYWLSKGIVAKKGSISNSGNLIICPGVWYRRADFYETLKDAEDRVKTLAERKILSLENRIDKIRKMYPQAGFKGDT